MYKVGEDCPGLIWTDAWWPRCLDPHAPLRSLRMTVLGIGRLYHGG